MSFGELLARAEAQAAAGHRWGPPGDNMTETIAGMMELIPTATPKQLADLSALLESDAAHLPRSSHEAAPNEKAADTPANPPTADAEATSPPAPSPPAPEVRATNLPAPNPPPAPSPPAPVVQAPRMPATNAQAEGSRSTVAPTSMVPATTSTVVAATQPDQPVDKQAKRMVASPTVRAAELFTRGQEAEQLGDVSGARRFFASAAGHGSAAAALHLGRLYDPAFLKQTALGGIDPDPALARHWYELAVAMGSAEAGPLLEALALR